MMFYLRNKLIFIYLCLLFGTKISLIEASDEENRSESGIDVNEDFPHVTLSNGRDMVS